MKKEKKNKKGFKEELMVLPFVKRYRASNDINMMRRITNDFLEKNGLSVFRFTKFLGDYDKQICDDFIHKIDK